MELTIPEIIGTISGGLIVISGVVMYFKRLGFSFGRKVKNNCAVKRNDYEKDKKIVDEKLARGEKRFDKLEGQIIKTGEDVSFIRGWIEAQ